MRQVLEIIVPHHLAADYGRQIEGAGGGRVRLIPIAGGGPADPDISRAEVAVRGDFEGPWTFAEILAAMPGLRWIHSLTAGVEDFVSPELHARGCLLTNSAGLFAPALAEYAVAAMVMLARRMPGWLDDQRAHRYRTPLVAPGRELLGSRVAIIGYGGVGRYVARLCRAAGMEVWANRRTAGPPIGEPVDRMLGADDVDALLTGTPFLVVCAPLTAATRGLVGARELRLLAPGAVIVHIGRGGIVDEHALVEALADGHVAGAMVDVTETEPLPADSPLWDAPNLWLTPHVAANTPASWDRSVELLCANVTEFLAGRPRRMANLVDMAQQL
jgi:phosphoglycerate dehydrogenase-like enzyme